MGNIVERCPRCGYYVTGVVSASDRQKQFGKSLASFMYGNSMANLFNNPFMRLPYAMLAYDNMSKNDGPKMYEFRCSCGYAWKSDGRSMPTKPYFDGNINRIWLEDKVKMDNLPGFNIHVSFSVNNLKNLKCGIIAYFYFANGNILKDFNNNYGTPDGQVATWDTFTPQYEGTTFNDFILFMPFNELHANEKLDLKFFLQLFICNNEFTNICVSDYYPFTYSPNVSK